MINMIKKDNNPNPKKHTNIYLTTNGSFAFDVKKGRLDLPDFNQKELFKKWGIESSKSNKSQDFTSVINNDRYRVHLFHGYHGWSAALRLMPDKILDLIQLGIKDIEQVISIACGTGLTLFCGAIGSGKSTTMNSVISHLLKIGDLGVTVTIEDPIEYLHTQDIIFQREVGKDINSFSAGLVDAMRVNPQTIVIGEIRDSETALRAVQAGANGHRVLATIHADSIAGAITRMWSLLDDQGDEQLIYVLQGIMAQHLMPYNQAQNIFYETLKINDTVRNLLSQIKNDKLNINALNQQFYQQQRTSLKEQKDKLINQGMDKNKIKF